MNECKYTQKHAKRNIKQNQLNSTVVATCHLSIMQKQKTYKK